MARQYLGTTGGFADGFTQGFGLMTEAANEKRKIEGAEEELLYGREKDRLDRIENKRQFDAEYKLSSDAAASELTESQEQTRIAREEAEANTAYRKSQLTITERSANAAQRASEATEAQAKAAIEQENALTAIANIDNHLKFHKGRGTQPDMALLNELISQTSGRFDLNKVLGAEYQSNLTNLSAGITDLLGNPNTTYEDINQDTRILMGMDAITQSGSGAMIGRVLDDTWTNAPDAYKDGKHTVVNREAINISIDEGSSEQGEQQLNLSSDVLVTVEDEQGELFSYIAPLTDGRDPSSNVRMQIPLNQFLDGVAGSAVLVNTMQEDFAPFIRQAKIEDMGGQKAFQEQVNSQLESILDTKEKYPSSRTYFSNKKNTELSTADIQRIAESRALGFGKSGTSYRESATRQALEVKTTLAPELGYYKLPDADNNPKIPASLTDGEALRLAATFNDEGKPSTDTNDLLAEIMKGKGAVRPARENSQFGGTGSGRIRTTPTGQRTITGGGYTLPNSSSQQ